MTEQTHKPRIDPAHAVLGLILLDPSLLGFARERIAEDDFYRSEHKRIWRGIQLCAEQGVPIDYGSVWRVVRTTFPDESGDDATAIMDLLDPEQHDPLAWFENGSPIRASDLGDWIERVKRIRKQIDRRAG